MNKSPMDMFEETDEMFARLFTRMDREFMTGNPQVYGYRIVIGNDEARDGMQEIPAPSPRLTHEPVTEVHRIGDETKVITELPGATEEMIRLDVKGDTLVIDAGDAESHYHTTADVPGVDAASMQRSFRNGVLEVTFRNLADTIGLPPSSTN
jgi:HSP20 family protein